MPSDRSSRSAKVVPTVVVAMITAQNRNGWNFFAAICAQLEVIAITECGHYPMQEAPPLTVSLVERFLAA